MKLSSFLTIVAVVGVLFGIAFVAAPAETLMQYGITADRYVAFMSRFFGLTLLTVGLIFWFARSVTDPVARRAFLIAGLIGDIIGFVVALQGQLSGLTNALGWLTIVIYGVFALGFAYFQFESKDRLRI
jgi:hypothetical protein